jgi:hypothetical protein
MLSGLPFARQHAQPGETGRTIAPATPADRPSHNVIEIVLRLGLALLLSLTLALLLAWGWDRSDTVPVVENSQLDDSERVVPLRQ